MKDRKNSSLLGHRLKFRWLFLFSLFAGPLPLSFGGQSAVAANNIIQQQKISVTGKVVDNLGEPIIGANVVVQGQTVGTITDIDGVFKLDVPKGAKWSSGSSPRRTVGNSCKQYCSTTKSISDR